MLLISVYQALIHTDIPVLRVETRLAIAVIVVAAGVLGLMIRLAGPWARLVMLTGVLFIHLDSTGAYTGLVGMLDLGNRIPEQVPRILAIAVSCCRFSPSWVWACGLYAGMRRES